jgi:hypothetical protein
MLPMRRVLLCGKNLFISGLQASLEMVPYLDLQLVETQPDHIRERITFWKPDVLILETPLLKTIFSILLDYPQLKVIGLDIEDNSLQVFSGSTSYKPTPEKLLEVIEECRNGD